jgi:ABC-2 type transport system permease protein
MRCALHAEWTKLRTLPGVIWMLIAAVVVMTAGSSAAAATAVRCAAEACTQDPAKVSLTGIHLGQAAVAVAAVLMIGAEYGTGMIRLTLAAAPRRTRTLAAKAAVLTGAVAVAGVVAVIGSLAAGAALLPGRGYPALGLGDEPLVRAAFGTVLYLVLIALLGLGIATAVRESSAAVGIVLGLLYLLPILETVVPDPIWRRHLQQVGPTSAGLAVQATGKLDALPIGPWAGLGVLSAWAAAAMLIGGLLLRFRDA